MMNGAPEKDEPDSKKTQNAGQNTEFAYKIFESNCSAIQFIDTKASILIGTSGIALSIIVGLGSDGIDLNNLLIIGVSLLLISSFFSLLVILPRFSKNAKTLIYYEGIVNNISSEEYVSKLQDVSPETILKDVGQNIFNLADIQKKKFFYMKISAVSLFVSLVFLLLSLI